MLSMFSHVVTLHTKVDLRVYMLDIRHKKIPGLTLA